MTAAVTVAPPRLRVRIMRISDAADLWLGELARQGKRPDTTIYTYRRFLGRLADRYDPRDVNELTLSMLRRFLDEQATNKKTQREQGISTRNTAATVAQQVTILSSFFRWLYDEGYVPENPAYRLRRPKQPRPEDNDGIVTVSAQDVQRLLAACRTMQERLCLMVLIYTGARRRAVANLRLSDYDPTAVPPTLTFREKGGKTITKPVARPLAELLDSAFLAGVWADGGDPWLVPPRSLQGHPSTAKYQRQRSDTLVYRIVKDVAARAGVDAHVHSMRGAFAVQFSEQHPDRLVALQALMGHSKLETTQVYLRRLDRRKEMETVVDLDYGSSVGPDVAETLRDIAAHHVEATQPPFTDVAAVERAAPHPEGSDG
jgi:integrase/recombinase XerD